MGSRALLFLLAQHQVGPTPTNFFLSFRQSPFSAVKKSLWLQRKSNQRSQNYSTTAKSSLEPPNLPRLAETARISLTPDEVEEFAPKIKQVVDWFGQLQAIDLESIEPTIRADTGGGNLRDDLPENFENREVMISTVPSYEEPYIKVPKVLNKEE